MSDNVRGLKYWLDEKASSRVFSSIFPLSKPQHYITFDVDIGGFNNIRMQFEYVVIMAAITGRTLVLPPPSPWYLINFGPIQREGDVDGVCDYSEFFDLSALRQYINVISTAEFIQIENDRLDIPAEFSDFSPSLIESERAGEREDLRKDWQKWLSIKARVLPWNPLNNLIYYPDINSVMQGINRPDERFRDRRAAVWFDADMNDSQLLHFPSNVEAGCRQLGQVSRLVAFADDQQARVIRLLLKHGLRYVPRVFEIAQTIIDQLGIYQYSSLHLRRNEIQFIESRADPETTAENISRLLEPVEPLYLATDETDESFFAGLKRQRKVYRFSDLANLPGLAEDPMHITPHKLIGCVEQLICAAGRIFVGTPHSSFSTYISRVHGYMNAPDCNEYSHTQLSSSQSRGFGFVEQSICGQNYLHEDRVLWEDADVDQPIYSVSCTDASDYAHWQCELLEFSWKQVEQSGELIRLVSREETHPLPRHKYTQVISTRFTNTHPETGDHYIPYNRLFSFQEWLNTGEQNGTVLILDPDCVFRKRVTTRVKPGAPIAQRWRGFAIVGKWQETVEKLSDIDIELIQDITWPALVHTEDMRRIMPRWIELTSLIRQEMGAWESDMMAFVVAAAEFGIRFTEQHLAAVLNWPEGDDEEAPVIHYCQAVEAKDGSQLWFKQGYQPWSNTNADPAMAKLPYCGDLVAILNQFVALHNPVTVEIEEINTNSERESSDHAAMSDPDSSVLVKAYLRHDKVLEFYCKRGDETMLTLFHALAENTAADGVPDDRLINVPTNDNDRHMAYFRLSHLIGLETIPAGTS